MHAGQLRRIIEDAHPPRKRIRDADRPRLRLVALGPLKERINSLDK
jgi:hypothetical protein